MKPDPIDVIQSEKSATPKDYPIYSTELVQRLNRILSVGVMREILNDNWCYAKTRDLTVEDCCAIRVYPRGNHEFVIEFQVKFQDKDTPVTVFGELVESDAEGRLQALLVLLRKKKRRQLSKKYETDLVSCLPDLGLILRFPGLDEKLIGLKLAYDQKSQRQVLSKYFEVDNLASLKLTVDFLGHRLGKRAVYRVLNKTAVALSRGETNGCHSIIAKAYKVHEDKGRNIFTRMQALSYLGFGLDAKDGIHIPQPIAFLGDYNLQLMEDIRGQLPSYDRDEQFEASGLALAKLHRTPLKLPQQHTVDDEIKLLRNSVAVTVQFLPELQYRLSAALQQVESMLNGCRCEIRTLAHRDFYDKQILMTSDRTILIDFDTLCLSDPALDIGNFLAHLHLAELQNLANAARLGHAFLEGYRDSGLKPDSGRIDAYIGASLLRLACLYALWPRWAHLPTQLLDRIP